MSSSEWKEVIISDTILSSNTGLDAIKRAPIVGYDSGIKCLRIQDISQEKNFEDWGFCAVEDKNYEKFQLKKGDIIVARTGATIGVNKLIKNDLKSVYNNGLIRIKVNSDIIDYRYLYYNLQGDNYRGHIQAISGGTSTQPNMKMNALLDFKIKLPPLTEQKVIADYLTCLDNKIELNNRMIKNLDGMVKTIFKSWFVDFEPFQEEIEDSKLGRIPKGWRVDSIGNCTSLVTRGIAPKYVEISDQYVINQKCIRGGSLNTALSRPHSSIVNKEKMLQFGDILINSTGVGTLGRVAQVYENLESFTVDSHVTIVRPNTPNKISYLGCLLKNMQTKFEHAGTGSTGQTELGRDIISQMSILVPNDRVLEKYTYVHDAIYKKIVQQQKENFILEHIRDSLLPKLMNGEIRVPIGGELDD